MKLTIQGRNIGDEYPPFIIAEMSGNHNGSLQQAHDLIDVIADTGADAVKMQTYTADTLTIDCDKADFIISGSNSPWEGRTLYDLYQEAHTPWEWQKELFEHAEEKGLVCISTPFDETAVKFLESIGCPAYKIASFENNDLNLIATVAKTGKPVIISTGLASIATIRDAVITARQNGCKELILLKCTSSYPADPINSNILTIPHMRELFDCWVGLSDHTYGIGVAVAATALGCVMIEKHIVLSREGGGIDSLFSMEPSEMKTLVNETKRAWISLGKPSYEYSAEEGKSITFKRSLYAIKDIAKGEVITEHNVKAIRPGYGLAPKYAPVIQGMVSCRSIDRGTAITWDLFNDNIAL